MYPEPRGFPSPSGTAGVLSTVAETLGIHDLELEDVKRSVRPNVNEFDDHVFVLLNSARLRGGETTFEEELTDTPVGIFFGADWIVTLSTGTNPCVQAVVGGTTHEETRLRSSCPDFDAARVVDAIVDGYFDVLDEIETDIETIEEEVVGATGIETLEHLNSVRRELLSTRRLLWPTRDALSTFVRGDLEYVDERHENYYRDVVDHLAQLVELTETYRDLGSGARDIYLNSLSMSTNEVMKRPTVVATIILPLTFIVGSYGMNFEGSAYNMPEFGWTDGYPAVLLGMGLDSGVILACFRSDEWL